MKKYLVFVFIIITIHLFADRDMEYLRNNEVAMPITNYGVFGMDVTTIDPGTYWPIAYTNETYIFGAGIWVAGLVDTVGGVDTLVTCGYDIDSGFHEFVPGITDTVSDDDTTVIHVLGWDEERNAYEAVCWFNDMDPTYHIVPENHPLNISVRLNAYQDTADILKNGVILEYTIYNNSDKTIYNAYVGTALDGDIGDEGLANDLLGFIPQKNVVYQYQLVSEDGWTNFPGVMAIGFLETPQLNTDMYLSYPDGVVDTFNTGDQPGLTTFMSFNISNTPNNKIDRYLVMSGNKGRWPSYASPENGVYEEDSSDEGDKRFLISTGPFTMNSGDSAKFVVVVYFQNYNEYRWYDVKYNYVWNKLYWNGEQTGISILSPSSDTVFSTSMDLSLNVTFSGKGMIIMMKNVYGEDYYVPYDDTISNTVSCSLTDIPDGYYDLYAVAFNKMDYRYFNGPKIKKDDPSENGLPIIRLYSEIPDIMSGDYTLIWGGLDVEDSTDLDYRCLFVADNTDTTELSNSKDTIVVFSSESFSYNTGKFVIYATDSNGGEGVYETKSFSPDNFVDKERDRVDRSDIRIKYGIDKIVIETGNSGDIYVVDVMGRIINRGSGPVYEWNLSNIYGNRISHGIYFVVDKSTGRIKKIMNK